MDELEETIVYDAMRSIMDNSKAICELVNQHGTEAQKKAYRDGVYSPAIKLQVILGTDGMERGKKRHDEMCERIKVAVAAAQSLPSNQELTRPAVTDPSTTTEPEAGSASSGVVGQTASRETK